MSRQACQPKRGTMKQCKKCKGKLSRRDIERYEELCAKCRVKEFDEMVMKKALACGYEGM